MIMSESSHAERIRVFLVDDHTVVRRGVRAFFDMLDDIDVLSEATDGKAALDELAVFAARDDLPDVVVMDLLMPRLGGITVATTIKRLYPHVEVVALTSFSEAERVHAALEAGAPGTSSRTPRPTRPSPRSPRRTAARYTSRRAGRVERSRWSAATGDPGSEPSLARTTAPRGRSWIRPASCR